MNKQVILLFAISLILISILATFVFIETNHIDSELNEIEESITTPQNYDYILYQYGTEVHAKNSTNQVEFKEPDLSQALMRAVEQGKNIVIQSNNYTLESDLHISNKSDISILASGVTFNCGGHSIIVEGENYLYSKNNLLEGLRIVNGTLNIRNSLSTTLSALTFEDCQTGLIISNSNKWTEDTRIEKCKFNNSKIAGIIFKTPTENGEVSYSKTGISDCEFWINDNSIGILVEPYAWFNDGYIRDTRMWFSESNQTETGIKIMEGGSMNNTYLSSVVFESFNVNFNTIGIHLLDSVPAPIIGSGVQFLGTFYSPVKNDDSTWIPAVGGVFKDNRAIPFGKEEFFEVHPMRIAYFDLEFDVTNLSSSETMPVTIKTYLIDESWLFREIRLSNNGLRALTFSEKFDLIPTRSLIKSVSVELGSSNSAAQVRVRIMGTTI